MVSSLHKLNLFTSKYPEDRTIWQSSLYDCFELTARIDQDSLSPPYASLSNEGIPSDSSPTAVPSADDETVILRILASEFPTDWSKGIIDGSTL